TREILRIVDGYHQYAGAAFDRRADVLLPHLGRHALFQVAGDGLLAVVAEKRGTVKLRQRLPQLIFRNIEIVDEDFFDGGVIDPGVGDRRFDVLLGDDALIDQGPEPRWLRLTGGAVLVVERDPQNACDLLSPVLVEGREDRSMPLVDELQNPQKVLLESDGHGQ